ncbi:unnamed protein product [Tenebrio molitor]|nr:unnamed protein product [Tenebrio molitor]
MLFSKKNVSIIRTLKRLRVITVSDLTIALKWIMKHFFI